jgi:hypothetical protein
LSKGRGDLFLLIGERPNIIWRVQQSHGSRAGGFDLGTVVFAIREYATKIVGDTDAGTKRLFEQASRRVDQASLGAPGRSPGVGGLLEPPLPVGVEKRNFKRDMLLEVDEAITREQGS